MVLQPINQKVKEEQREHGVFYEDEYNYLQHLKDREKVEHDWPEADRFVIPTLRKCAPTVIFIFIIYIISS